MDCKYFRGQNSVCVGTHTVENTCYLPNCSHYIFCVYLNLCRLFLKFCRLFFYEALRGCLQNTHIHTHTQSALQGEVIQYSSLWKETCVSWAHTDGARSGVVDEEVVSVVTGTPVHQTAHCKESTMGAEMVSKTRASPSVQFLLSDLDLILQPSGLLGFFFKCWN